MEKVTERKTSLLPSTPVVKSIEDEESILFFFFFPAHFVIAAAAPHLPEEWSPLTSSTRGKGHVLFLTSPAEPQKDQQTSTTQATTQEEAQTAPPQWNSRFLLQQVTAVILGRPSLNGDAQSGDRGNQDKLLSICND